MQLYRGVLGTTGIETIEIVRGIVDNIKPKLVIAIDSLCSKNIDRINKSIQISDTGIIPGGGVGNRQEELSKETLGVPVLGYKSENLAAFYSKDSGLKLDYYMKNSFNLTSITSNKFQSVS